MSAGLLIARLILGLGIAAHGSQKLFGWFGGHGPQGTGGFLHGLGFRPGIIAIAGVLAAINLAMRHHVQDQSDKVKPPKCWRIPSIAASTPAPAAACGAEQACR